LKITDVSGVNFVAVFNVKVTDAFEMRETVDVSCLFFIFSLSGFNTAALRIRDDNWVGKEQSGGRSGRQSLLLVSHHPEQQGMTKRKL